MVYRVIAFAFILVGNVAVAQAAPGDGPYDIMRPEPATPGVVKPYASPRRTQQRVVPVRPATPPEQAGGYVPPPVVVPQTGRLVPSQPVMPQGYVPGGQRETFSDRATRCAHQAGLAGLSADQRGSYLGSCINQ